MLVYRSTVTSGLLSTLCPLSSSLRSSSPISSSGLSWTSSRSGKWTKAFILIISVAIAAFIPYFFLPRDKMKNISIVRFAVRILKTWYSFLGTSSTSENPKPSTTKHRGDRSGEAAGGKHSRFVEKLQQRIKTVKYYIRRWESVSSRKHCLGIALHIIQLQDLQGVLRHCIRQIYCLTFQPAIFFETALTSLPQYFTISPPNLHVNWKTFIILNPS